MAESPSAPPNLLVVADVGQSQVQVSWQRGNALRRAAAPTRLHPPMSPQEREELRWYLERFLLSPYGGDLVRAERVERLMGDWGAQLFRAVFVRRDPQPDPRAFYEEAVYDGLDRCELCISSDDPTFLSLPWELLRDETPGRGFLARQLGGLYRQHNRASPTTTAGGPGPGKPYRVLLVVAQPGGANDVPFRSIARPVVEALRPLRSRVQIELLRPPTFDALQRRLSERPGYYQLVHFDGHGVFSRAGAGFSQRAFEANRGHLLFEKPDGSRDVVDSGELGEQMANCQVPLFVLNACQSAQEGGHEAFSSVASQLVAAGATGVVAMTYSVYVETASRFMERFYQRLIEQAPLYRAVADGRRRLSAEPGRESVAGQVELQDWVVPGLYQQAQGFVPMRVGSGPPVAAEPTEPVEAVVQRRPAEEVCPEGQYGFVGRDADFLRIERALRDDARPWVVLQGVGGTGKTELAYGFARWYAETGGCPGGVFATSFRHSASFGQVIGSLVGHGSDFSRLPDEEQWSKLVGYLREQRCLLVWDNVEPVAGYPSGAEPLASAEERQKLARFLQALRGGQSRVLLTTRKEDERWLGVAYRLLEIGGLDAEEVPPLARTILDTVGRQPEDFRADPAYARLLGLLRGHPRSLELVLPELRRRRPDQIIEALQHRVDALSQSIEDASLTFAFDLLGERAQRHLPFLGLFASFVHAGTLGDFVGAGDEQQQVYVELLGEALDAIGWEAVLDEAARSGLLRAQGDRGYELHPTLPAFLRRRLHDSIGEVGLQRLDTEFSGFYGAWSTLFLQATMAAQPDALIRIGREESNLLRAIDLAARSERWSEVQAIVQTLGESYSARARIDEWRAIRSDLLERVGRQLPADVPPEQADLWMYLLGDEATEALDRHQLERAEASYQSVRDYLIGLQDPACEPHIATAYHQLGRVEQERQRFDQAEAWYRQALEISERLGLDRDVASTYHQLGRVEQERQRLDQAETWYGQALEIYKRLGLERNAAITYHQLGRVEQERQRYEQAEVWYRQALEIRERLGLERDASSTHHQLGVLAQQCERYEQAEACYRKALEIRERLGLERAAADTHHQLGVMARHRQRFDECEAWFRQALEVYERLGLERDAASTYDNLGILARQRQRFDESEALLLRALAIYQRLAHPPLLVNTLAQLGVLKYTTGDSPAAVGWLGQALAIATAYQMRLRGQILVDLARLVQTMGDQAFGAAWRAALPGEPPTFEALQAAWEQLPEAGDEGGAESSAPERASP